MNKKVPVLHYAIPGSNLEVIDLVRAKAKVATDCWQFFLWASALQYLWRYDLKGKPMQDLCKTSVYLNWLKEAVGGKT